MTEKKNNEFLFKLVTSCNNPMEVEIYPATLRERRIPHRTEWSPSGELAVLVPENREADAREALENAARVFFGNHQKDRQDLDQRPQPGEELSRGAEALCQEIRETAASDQGSEEEGSWLAFGRPAIIGREGLPSPDETRTRPIWPAWALAALPGAGLGHLYAGKFQIFLYLAFLSVLGVLFFEFTKSYLSFLLNLFSWIMDLGFAAYHVKEHNRRAHRHQSEVKEAEQMFLDSL